MLADTNIRTLITLLKPINQELPEDRADLCYPTTLKVAKVLFDNKIPFKVVYSTDAGGFHWFCLSNELIVDLTASQFNNPRLQTSIVVPFTFYPNMLICDYNLMRNNNRKFDRFNKNRMFKHFNIDEVAAVYEGGNTKITYLKLTDCAQEYIDTI